MRILNSHALERLAKDSSYPARFESKVQFRRSGEEKFQKRYMVLKGNLLFYFVRKSDRIPYGLIVLQGYTIELSSEQDGYCFQLLRRASLDQRQQIAHTIVVESPELLESWISALTNNSYEQLKLTVESLQQRMSDVLAAKRAMDVNGNRIDDEEETISDQTVTNTIETNANFAQLHKDYGDQIKLLLDAAKSPQEHS